LTRTPRVVRTLHDQAGKLPGYAENLRERISGRSLAYAGAGLALAGTGAAAGFAGPAAGPASAADSINQATAPIAASQHPGRPETASHQVKHVLPHATEATKAAVRVTGKPAPAATKNPATHSAKRADATYGSARPASAHHTAAHHAAAGHSAAGHSAAGHSAAGHSAAGHASTHQQPARRLTLHWSRGGAGRTHTWDAIERIVAGQPVSHAKVGPLPAADRLTPVGTTGPQSWMAMTPARYDNATTIVRQVIAKKMGMRSAVIAVATAMQESTLLNINYGDSDSVGLFQQRPSCGWGTATQILHPAYATDAFLNALSTYQDRDPGWSQQPLWQTAQGVQASGFPTAYARWETQAAGLVHSIARHLIWPDLH
jgi:hypothetical protein